jgi:hypothetical protein
MRERDSAFRKISPIFSEQGMNVTPLTAISTSYNKMPNGGGGMCKTPAPHNLGPSSEIFSKLKKN